MEAAHTSNDSLTPSQRQAVGARGNVLIMAGAGTGKTKTLVARCLDCLERERASLDELLIVTFTEAAAAEMRQRLRKQLEEQSIAQPDDDHWPRQLALFDIAHIGTLHSFCLRLVREHFYELGLDPLLAILDQGEARQRAGETLDEQFQLHYEGDDEFSRAVQSLIQVHGGGRDERIRALVLRLHNYSQARPDAAGWLAEQIRKFSTNESTDWQNWLLAAIEDWRDERLPVLEGLKNENEKAAELAGFLSRLGSAPAPGAVGDAPVADARREGASNHTRGARAPQFTRELAAEILEQIVTADASWPAKRKTILRKPLEDLFDEAAFLAALAPVKNGGDPLVEDWNWVRGHMETLLRLAQEFAGKFAGQKLADGVLDFHDLEQFALKLLWDFAADAPTDTAKTWREKLRFIFVDEYQDINAAQDKIIAALARDGSAPVPGAATNEDEFATKRPDGIQQTNITASGDGRAPAGNRFLVGDVKQSIYRFRLADPKIFRDYARQWHGEAGQVIPLSENFRSREGLLHFVNSVFAPLMREEIGGVAYDNAAQLIFGAPEARVACSIVEDAAPRAELLLRFKTGRNEPETPDEETADGLADLGETEKEARMLALRLCELRAKQHEVWDDDEKKFRAVEWRDMAVLLRAMSGKSEIYAMEFERAGVPLVIARGGFYESSEISDLLSLLQLLDNPLQDVPCIAVLRSPLVGLSLDELAAIRLTVSRGHFWTALNRFHALTVSASRPLTPALSPGGGEGAVSAAAQDQCRLAETISQFLERFARWRKLARQASLSRCLEQVLAETYYADWLRSRPRGAQRCANVGRFLNLAQKFDQFQRQGLFRFLKFIAAQRAAEVEPEVPSVAEADAVRLMSIHQSKGLEFPVVVVADLAKPFNQQDRSSEIIFDEELGLCPRVKPPQTERRYPSLPHWLAQRHQRREQAGEELRLLYVALTRARDTLILSGSIPETKWTELWPESGAITSQKILAAKSYADWLGLWFAQQPGANTAAQGELPQLRWRIVADAELKLPGSGRDDEAQTEDQSEPRRFGGGPETMAPDGATLEKLREVLTWEYRFGAATERAAKSSVTALRRQAADELADETEQIFPARRNLRAKLSAADAGTAHHKFLQHVLLGNTGSAAALEAEAIRLEKNNVLSADERATLNLPALAAFWNSDVGQKIRRHEASVKRELAFTAKFGPQELSEISGMKSSSGLAGEFIVVQGVADLAVLLPEEIWLLDFKTDDVRPEDLPAKITAYEPQLKLYAGALEKIYALPVTNCWLHFLTAQQTKAVTLPSVR